MAEIKIGDKVFNKIVEINDEYVRAKMRIKKLTEEIKRLKRFITRAEKFYKELNVVPPADPDVKVEDVIKGGDADSEQLK